MERYENFIEDGCRTTTFYNGVRVKDNSKSKCFLVMRKIESL